MAFRNDREELSNQNLVRNWKNRAATVRQVCLWLHNLDTPYKKKNWPRVLLHLVCLPPTKNSWVANHLVFE